MYMITLFGYVCRATHNDEMCNFYIMYYMDAAMEHSRGSDTCPGNNVPQVSANLPADADTPLPPNPLLEEHAKGHVHHAPVEQPSAGGPQTLQPQHVPVHKGIVSQVKSGSVGDGNLANVDKDNRLQGNSKYSVSDSKSSFDDDYSSFGRRPNPKLLSYYDYPDYYDILRQRSRVKKPLYDDLMGSRMNSFSDYTDPGMMMSSGHMMMDGPSKSRNRNKFFVQAANQHYNDYSGEQTLQDSTEDLSQSNSDSPNLNSPTHALNSKGSNSNEAREGTVKAANDVTAATAGPEEGIQDGCSDVVLTLDAFCFL